MAYGGAIGGLIMKARVNGLLGTGFPDVLEVYGRAVIIDYV